MKLQTKQQKKSDNKTWRDKYKEYWRKKGDLKDTGIGSINIKIKDIKKKIKKIPPTNNWRMHEDKPTTLC